MRIATVLAVFLLAACSGEPAPSSNSGEPKPPTVSREPALPTFAELNSGRECHCVEQGECPTTEAADGEGESRGFQCRWVDRGAMLAECRYESRFKPAYAAGGGWTPWETAAFRFRIADDRGWCWTEDSEATGSDP